MPVYLVTEFSECGFFESLTPKKPLETSQKEKSCTWTFGGENFMLVAFNNQEDCQKELKNWQDDYDGVIVLADFDIGDFCDRHPDVPVINIEPLPDSLDVRDILTDLYRAGLFTSS